MTVYDLKKVLDTLIGSYKNANNFLITAKLPGKKEYTSIIEFDVDTDEFLSFICYPKYTNSKITKTVIKLLSNSVGIALEKNADYYF